jgi:hypothetical protein
MRTQGSARRLAGIALGAIGVLFPAVAAAQPAPPHAPESVELTGFYGARTGGSFLDSAGRIVGVDSASSFGGLLDVDLRTHDLKLELLFSRQQSHLAGGLKLDLDQYQIGVMQEVRRTSWRYHGAVLLGAMRLAPRGFDEQYGFSLGLGTGLKVYATRNVGLRLDARLYMSFVDAQGDAVCSGGCVFFWTGTVLWQADFTAGLSLAF